MGFTATDVDGRAPARFPLATQLLFIVSFLCEVVFVLTPLSYRNLFHEYELHCLLVGPFTYGGGMLSLGLCLLVGGSRLRDMEHQKGTFGALIYFLWANLSLCALHILVNSALWGLGLHLSYMAEFNGAWALTALLYTIDAKADFYEKVLVVGGYPILMGMMPIIVFFCSWVFAWELPVDVVMACILGYVFGERLDLPDTVYDSLENAPDLQPWLQWLSGWSTFVQRGNQGFRKLLPQYRQPRPQNGVFQFSDHLQAEGGDLNDVSGGNMGHYGNYAPDQPEELLGYTVGNAATSPASHNSGYASNSPGGAASSSGAPALVQTRQADEAAFRGVNIQAPPGMRPAARSYETVADLAGGQSPTLRTRSNSPANYAAAHAAAPGNHSPYGRLQHSDAAPGYAGQSANAVFANIPPGGGHLPDVNAGKSDPFDFDF